MNLKQLVSLGALSVTLSTTPTTTTAQTPPESSVTPPEINAELHEAPRAEIDSHPTPKTEATRRFLTYQEVLADKVPTYATKIWEETFTTPDDKVIFTPTDQETIPDTQITVLDKDTTWTPSYLSEHLPEQLRPSIHDTIDADYPWNAKQLNQAYDHPDTITWTSGRQRLLKDNLSEHGEFLRFYEDSFTDVNLPVETVAQLGVESAFNPLAESYAACGVGQIRTGHLKRIQDKQPLPGCENPVMAKLTANIMKAQMLVYDISYFESLTMYHSGLGNRNKAHEIGDHINPDQRESLNYYAGLQAMFENSDDEQLNELLGSAGSDTRHYPLQVNALTDIYHDLRDTTRSKPMTTYRVNDPRGMETLAEQSGVPQQIIRDYNPQIDGGTATPGTYVNLPGGSSVPGDNVSTWNHPTNTFLHRLRDHDFTSNQDSLVTELDSLIDVAEQRGHHWWTGALRFIKHNQEAQNAVRSQTASRIQRITTYLSGKQPRSAGTRSRR